MTVRLIFLGKLADLAGGAERTVTGPLDWAGLCAVLGSDMAQVVADPAVRVACSGTVLADKHDLSAGDGDEVALLPPVSGG